MCAFDNCTGLIGIIFGSVIPEVGVNIFFYSATNRTITVKIPSCAIGYVPPGTQLPITYIPTDTSNSWVNNFRSGTSNMTIIIAEQD